MKKSVVVALGGNALVSKGKFSIRDQQKVIQKVAHEIVSVHKTCNLLITHGNGPQVGNILIRVEEALGKAYSLPLEVCVAESEGEIGYLIEQAILNASPKANVVSILTQVEVDKKDKAFKNPSKPIGPFYKTAVVFKKKKIKYIEDAGRGYRRVVPSPSPIKILESKTIQRLVDQHNIVIAAGGGGIPVTRQNGKYKGVEAVIDKDAASAVLANAINAHTLLIITSVKKVSLNFNKPHQQSIKKITVKEAEEYIRQNQFATGSMLPKIEASIQFLQNGGKRVIITSPGHIKKALEGREGTVITR